MRIRATGEMSRGGGPSCPGIWAKVERTLGSFPGEAPRARDGPWRLSSMDLSLLFSDTRDAGVRTRRVPSPGHRSASPLGPIRNAPGAARRPGRRHGSHLGSKCAACGPTARRVRGREGPVECRTGSLPPPQFNLDVDESVPLAKILDAWRQDVANPIVFEASAPGDARRPTLPRARDEDARAAPRALPEGHAAFRVRLRINQRVASPLLPGLAAAPGGACRRR